jgi:hypothetical protein
MAVAPFTFCFAGLLHGIGDDVAVFPVLEEQMDRILGHHKIQYTVAKTLPDFKEPANPGLALSSKFQQKLPLMTVMSQVPNLSSHITAMRPSHDRALIRMASFSGPKSEL